MTVSTTEILSDADRFSLIKKEFLDSEKGSLRSLARKYDVSYSKLCRIARKENWRQRENETDCQNRVTKGGSATELECKCSNSSSDRLKGRGGLSTNGINTNPQDPVPSDEEKEYEHLRLSAFDIAKKAASSIALKEDWNPKDFEILVNTWVKLVGTRTKMDGDDDGIGRLLSELTAGTVIPDTSDKMGEDVDES